jgi:hypothetical protein
VRREAIRRARCPRRVARPVRRRIAPGAARRGRGSPRAPPASGARPIRRIALRRLAPWLPAAVLPSLGVGRFAAAPAPAPIGTPRTPAEGS